MRPELRQTQPGDQATTCKNQKCHLPDCLCGQNRLKGELIYLFFVFCIETEILYNVFLLPMEL